MELKNCLGDIIRLLVEEEYMEDDGGKCSITSSISGMDQTIAE